MNGRVARGRAAIIGVTALLLATGAAPPAVTVPADVFVDLHTTAGDIVLDLDRRHAPITTVNFLRYVDQKRFDGTEFYRAMHLSWGDQPNGLIQGGIQADPKRALKPIAHEPTDRTGILNKAGAISMARYAPGTATGDFTILLSDQPSLDARPDASDADGRAGFAAFGHVVQGMEVVRTIWDAPRSPTAGEGVMKGQMIADPVKIVTARRIAEPLPAVATPVTADPTGK